jgi:hypothetical protein
MNTESQQMLEAGLPFAPELSVMRWFNQPEPLSLAKLRGRVVLLYAFQMLCPGCVAHGTPQAEVRGRMHCPKSTFVRLAPTSRST